MENSGVPWKNDSKTERRGRVDLQSSPIGVKQVNGQRLIEDLGTLDRDMCWDCSTYGVRILTERGTEGFSVWAICWKSEVRWSREMTSTLHHIRIR